jgi:glutamine synthetase
MSAPGMNLLDPGETPKENLQFLLFLAAVIKAVDEYQDLLRVTVATPGNDHRLGAQEAPPAIISIFVGEELADVIEAITSDDTSYTAAPKLKMDLGVDVLPKFAKDTTDRNRTSPFAFTGNKFEFRMPGSSQNLSDANTVLNTAVAKELKGYADELEQAEDFDSAVIALVKRTIRDHKRVIFNGNGYSQEWEEEAEKRGLCNLKSTVDALPALLAEKNVKLLNDFGVMSPIEVQSRYEVEVEHYSKILHIEAKTMLGMARRKLIPAALTFQADVAATASSKKSVCESISIATEKRILATVSTETDAMDVNADELETELTKAEQMEGMEQARQYHDKVIPCMAKLRAAADHIEIIIGDDYWPLPTYSQMLFYVE